MGGDGSEDKCPAIRHCLFVGEIRGKPAESGRFSGIEILDDGAHIRRMIGFAVLPLEDLIDHRRLLELQCHATSILHKMNEEA